tara:strand:- start:1457 stop:1657 length:201 start_codon:yes stop_codon:yes gene_type:complete
MYGKKKARGDAAKAALGSGGRFKALSSKLKDKGAKDPDALAAYIGRKKHGARKMAALAAAGRSRSA